jgi:ABC-type Zn uptake system ZnuABC Zn-binding protein ZnuA
LQNYKLGVLDPKAREICENFKEVAATLTQLDKEIHPQLESLNKTVQSIKPQVNQLLESYRKNNPVAASVSSNQSSSKSSTKKDNKSRKAPPTAVKAPIQRFNELLDKN